MNNFEKLELISGVTDYAYCKVINGIPEMICYESYKNFTLDYASYLNSISSINRPERKLEFEFVSRYSKNAIAYIENDIDYIGINEGCLIDVYHIFNELLIKGALNKYIDFNDLINITANLDNGDDTENTFFFKFPNDYTAKVFSELICMISMKFIILHEVGHHLNGHLLFLDNKYNFKELNYKILEPTLIKTLEMDADAFAVTNLIHVMKHIFNNEAEIKKLNLSNELKLGLIIFSLNSLFLALKHENDDNIISKEYMSNDARKMLVFICLEQNLKIIYPELLFDIDYFSVFNEFTKESEYYYKHSFDFESNISTSLSEVQIELKQSYTEMKLTWNSIYDELSNFSRLNLSPKYKI